MSPETAILTIEGMSCEHCVSSVNKAVGALQGVFAVNVDLTSKQVTVNYDPQIVSLQSIKDAIEDQGYEVK